MAIPPDGASVLVGQYFLDDDVTDYFNLNHVTLNDVLHMLQCFQQTVHLM